MTATPTLAEVIAALPHDLDDDRPIAAPLAALSAIGARALPVGRFGRMWALGTLQAQLAAAYLSWWLRTLPASAGERQRQLDETHLRNALRVLGTMSYLRGAIMKVGQMLAAWPDVVPDQFAAALGRLWFEAPPMHYALVREALVNELEREPEEAFAHFEREAFAAASFGQVHRARLAGGHADGAQLAVKVQYPHIAAAIRSDLANLRLASLPMRLSADWDNLMGQLADIQRMLEQETDYARDAEFTRLARETLADDERFVVPRVHAAHSTARVLTMDFIDGVHLDDFLAQNPSQHERDHCGEMLVRSSMRLYYRARLLYADPQPGNYLFRDDGRLGLIDFGCCHRFNDDEWEQVSLIEQALAANDDARIEAAIARSCDLTPRQRQDGGRMRLLREYCDWLWAPVAHVGGGGAFDFGDRAYFQRGVELFGEVVKRRYTRSLPVNNWLGRTFFGIRAMLTRLGARVEYGRIMREETTVPWRRDE